ncbi:2-dehydro-3-deoxyphosphogluconate aldolase/(4S)-4-hydroxy-2-oxoglutarate aldolase [Saccharopolyspora erythraea NRRL 2338]|uniref:2-dehydro-3-deoxy-phosphogluconate aldolase n=2 Tax=Saccharopolyspora erythraea TaxID=1836 RepID=A4FAI2_SACEN|nr:bifunctional 4-hydroxy-2-oxoglutarate aldolase/2-dehydro-3-deoxy-phosphogluconate aldolase [Saccharopolyspora erythraea]EQD83319.1 ketohydroxyglutarate aldolase [Saccharopolyspora erythraea D]PFG94845.1 2-dehydro-3-deoxyphosphogluconate aldolase/(4S)-4-hydroxy-2-oxoglutarate aldolase [Saccharopolyspora erythraea NRRL 2338]QRK91551.1 bifunctional 4-hydroxy-2-oxoglutarate aldolase/2-dehydro-3-deoxy-phosphogluconate aldolase [Saccharopolyspora erythraea]QUH01275.1 bifunctional 4-hydroxy-2-oxogl
MNKAINTAADVLTLSPVVPVVALDDPEHAVPLAEALLRGGISTIEVTLRTPAGLPAIERIAAEVPDVVVGAGTVTEPGQAELVAKAGARYVVTPGSTPKLLDDVESAGIPYLAGVSTVSEAMALAERGVTAMKFFPAEPSGGVPYLKAIAGPLPGLRFCPTGGISVETAPKYLALANVGCVGGSWLTPKKLLDTGSWGQVEALARQASALG